jgi:phosphoglucomutase
MSDYIPLLQSIFDFPKIRELLTRPNFKCLFDSLNGVTGPYAKTLFVKLLGAPENSTQNDKILTDFGGFHPDPNLVYAKTLVDKMYSDKHISFGCAWDGDGDRNMILGDNFFVTPSDSVAIIVANAHCIPFYSQIKAVARSMPTSGALDRVAKKLGIPFYEVPTGWKFFGNLMDKYEAEGSSGFICGEESFGTGSAHIREKDGIWASLAWLSIIADKNPTPDSPSVSVEDIVRDHWRTYGRNYYCRYDYEKVDQGGADKLIATLRELAKKLKRGDKLGPFEIDFADEFNYKDPVDNSLSSNQGTRFVFVDGSRFVVRLSGTGSVGATIRLYLEKYEPDPAKHNETTSDALKILIQTALDTLSLKNFIGTDVPTVIT